MNQYQLIIHIPNNLLLSIRCQGLINKMMEFAMGYVPLASETAITGTNP